MNMQKFLIGAIKHSLLKVIFIYPTCLLQIVLYIFVFLCRYFLAKVLTVSGSM